MGIRIHKVMGYGITNFKGEKDPRFTPKFFDNEWQEDDSTVEDLLKWALKNPKPILEAGGADFSMLKYMLEKGYKESDIVKSELLAYTPEVRKQSLVSCVTYEEEFGLKNVVVFQPYNMAKNWKRYDDDIDYAEASRIHVNNINKLKDCWSGLYPHNANMYRFRGEPVAGWDDEHYLKGVLGVSEYSIRVGYWDRKIKPIAPPDILKDLKENWRCSIPVEITANLLYLGIVKDVKSFINELRPMVYTYWG